MIELYDLVGWEQPLPKVAQTIHDWAQTQHAAEVGALHVTCSDESERECVEALQHGFTDRLLPPMKFARRSAFQISNLGGRYEWGAAPLAEDHFLSKRSRRGHTVMVAKINAHVAFEDVPSAATATTPFRLGVWDRYGRDSTSCGALNALVTGKRSPFLDDLREAFDSEGHDRLAALRDSQRVDPLLRPLAAAVVSARLQARKSVLDLQDHAPAQPIYWVVLPCVTVNRHAQDTEIVCGVYAVDGRNGKRVVTYSGLGDDAAAYRIERVKDRFTLTDDQMGVTRHGRNHRQMVLGSVPPLPDHIRDLLDERLSEVRQEIQNNTKQAHHHHTRELLKRVLQIYAEIAPVDAAGLAFAHGVAAIHHAYKIHTLAAPMTGETQASLMLAEVYDQIDHLNDRHAELLLGLLIQNTRS
jgi:hypothetical protein